jgi:ribosome biogenesis GTPase / thiamine phosphate phosphatase
LTNQPDSPSYDLTQWGWTNEWDAAFLEATCALKSPANSYLPARILAEQRDYYDVASRKGKHRAEAKGRLRKKSEIQPAVGDWVVLDEHDQIVTVLPRATCLRRKAAGETEDVQIMACNVDWIFVTTSLNQDFNLRRLERFFVAAKDSRARTALVLTKSDLAPDPSTQMSLRETVSNRFGNEIEVLFTSAKNQDGIGRLRDFLKPHLTGVFLGTSGVGKSSLVNSLLTQDVQSTGEIREDDDKGRHTTTGRNSYLLPTGGIIIDSPGIRELQLADEGIRVEDEFSDLEEVALRCKFTNCQHENEKGCAIRAALEDGSISADRLFSYRKLKAELAAKSKRKFR